MHTVIINSNHEKIQVLNKYGESFGYVKKGENKLIIDQLKKYNTTLMFKHPDMRDTTIKLRRKVRGGAFTLDFFIFYPMIVYDFATADMYKIKRSSKVINLDMQYTDEFYTKKFKNLNNADNPEVYLAYINEYPKSPYKSKAEQKMYDLAYEIAKKENSVESYEIHNKKYPESTYVNDAQNKIYSIAYNKAVLTNTSEAFEEYINKYPNSPKKEEANKTKLMIKEIETEYSKAIKSNSYSAY